MKKNQSELFDKIVYLISKAVRLVLRLCGIRYAAGCLVLVADGVNSVHINTGFTPKEVKIDLSQRESGINSDISWFSREIIHGGFILTGKVNSFRTVEWIAKG